MNKSVRLWISVEQGSFATGVAAEFPGVPQRYCDNHFLRDLAKPELEAHSHSKVQIRFKVRRLQKIEQAVLRRQIAEALTSHVQDDHAATVTVIGRLRTRLLPNPIRPAPFCSSIVNLYEELSITNRYILQPPDLLMAAALKRFAIIQRNTMQKLRLAHKQLGRPADCIDRGFEHPNTMRPSPVVEDIDKVTAP